MFREQNRLIKFNNTAKKIFLLFNFFLKKKKLPPVTDCSRIDSCWVTEKKSKPLDRSTQNKVEAVKKI